MNEAPFSLYHVEKTITEESSRRGDYASEDPTETRSATLREALDALHGDCWDSVDLCGDTIICYPADYHQDIRTGDWSAADLIIIARRPSWAERLLDVYDAQRP